MVVQFEQFWVVVHAVVPFGFTLVYVNAAAVPQTEVERMAATWDKLLRDEPDAVAETIVAGLVRRDKRILCGADSTRIDVIQRLMPENYWNLFRKKILPKGK